MINRIEEFANKNNITGPTRDVPPKIFAPLIEAAVTEDDDELQDLWARMLINAADANSQIEVRHAYISILQDCTRLDVRILAALYNVPAEFRGASIRAGFLPDQVRLVRREDSVEERPRPAPDVLRSLWNLRRLGLIASDTALADGDAQMWNVSITALGVGLVEACTLENI